MELARAFDEDNVAPSPPRRPALRAVGRDEEPWAGAGDREMMEATAATVGLVAAKWKVEVLYLLAAGVRRHSRLNDHLVVSKKVLSDALKSLVRDGLVRRDVYGEMPVRVEYTLTPLGRSLTGPLFALYEWSAQHLDDVEEARDGYDRRHGAQPLRPEELPRFSAAFQVRAHG